MNRKNWIIGLTTLSLIFTLAFTSSYVKAENFKGKESTYIKLCSSSKLTTKQQKTCKEFNTYLNKKNKELSKEASQTKKDVIDTKETIDSLEQKLEEYDKKIDSAQKELTYVNNNIASLEKQMAQKEKLLEDRLYNMQSSFNSNVFVSYIYNSDSIIDFIRRIINIHEITQYENELIADLTDSLKEVEKQKSTLSLLKDSLKKEQAKQEETKKKYYALLQKQNNEIAANHTEISKNQESMETIEKNLAAIKKASDESKVNNVTHATPNKKPPTNHGSNSGSGSNSNSNTGSNSGSQTNNGSHSNTNTNNNKDEPSNNGNSSSNNNSNKPTSSAELGLAIANKALTRQGYMYLWGGGHSWSQIKNPSSTRFDCSGLVNWSHYQAGVNLGKIYTTSSLVSAGKSVSKSNLQAGDIILFSSNGSSSGVHHVGIYIGGNRMVHAPSTGKPVQVADLSYSYWQKEWYTCRRLY